MKLMPVGHYIIHVCSFDVGCLGITPTGLYMPIFGKTCQETPTGQPREQKPACKYTGMSFYTFQTSYSENYLVNKYV